MLMIWVSS